MKYTKIIIISLLSIFLFNMPGFSKVITGGVDLEWTLLNQSERDKTISFYHNMLFENIDKKIDTAQFAENQKDHLWKTNQYLLKENMFSLPDRKLAGFYLFGKLLYAYAIRYENNKKHIYYYDAMGGLRYIDNLEKDYDQYPYKAYQYNNLGKLKGVTYYISEYDQYAFKANGEFYCRWYQDKCYDKRAKMTLTRKIED